MSKIPEEIEEFREWREWNYHHEDGWSLEGVAARILSDLHAERNKSRGLFVELRSANQRYRAALAQLDGLKNSAGIVGIWGNRVRINYRRFFKTLSFMQRQTIKKML